MPREYVIRHAVRNDAADLAAFAARSFEEAFGSQNRPEDMSAYIDATYSEDRQGREIEDAGTVTLVAENEGTMIAFAQMRRGPEENAIEIARFYVDRDWHGHGVAQRLMNEIDAVASSIGARRIWLGVWERNPRAIAFYSKCGFHDIGSHSFLVGSDLQTDRIMSREVRVK